jgi:hypothetical protein
MGHRQLGDLLSPFIEKYYIMFGFTPVYPDINHFGLLSLMTGDPHTDQFTVFLLWRSQRDTFLTVRLVDLGDGPLMALAARDK